MARIFQTPGRGRSKCGGCGAYFASRFASCTQCGWRRPITRERPKKRTKKELAPLGPVDPGTLVIGQGNAPVRLEGTSRAQIQQWAQAIVDRRPKTTLEQLELWVRAEPVTRDSGEIERSILEVRRWNHLYRTSR